MITRVLKRIENIKNTKQLQCRKLYQERIDSILKSMNADENVVHVKTGDEGHIVVKYDIDHLHDCSVTFHKRKVDGGYYRVNQCAYICTTEEEIYTAIKEISGNPIQRIFYRDRRFLKYVKLSVKLDSLPENR